MNGFALYNTKIGNIRIDYDDEAVIAIKVIKGETADSGERSEIADTAYKELSEYFNGKRKVFDFPIKMIGTDFQKKVWKALLEIPYGETRTYKDIAKAIGNEKASRAVGMANNRNPLPFVVPCHRVIGAGGKLIGYAYGLDMKQKLLKLERDNK